MSSEHHHNSQPERSFQEKQALIVRATLLTNEELSLRKIAADDTSAVSKTLDDVVLAIKTEIGLSTKDTAQLWDHLNKRFLEPAARLEHAKKGRTDWSESVHVAA